MHQLVIGLGETGQPLLELLREAYPDAKGYDLNAGESAPSGPFAVLHICIPHSEHFLETVAGDAKIFAPDLIIVHTTVPVGTTAKIPNAVHSPILGQHQDMLVGLRRFTKWIGGARAEEAAAILGRAGMRVRTVPTSNETELLKLLCLAKYGLSIAFSHYERELFDKYEFDFSHILEWDLDYNLGVLTRLRRPVLAPTDKRIGGHCVIPGTRLLDGQHPDELLKGILRHG